MRRRRGCDAAHRHARRLRYHARMRGLIGLAGVVVAIGIAAGCGGGGGGGGAPAPTKVTVIHPGPTLPGEVMALVLNDSAGRFVSSTAVTSSGATEVTVPHDGSVILA